MKGMVNKVICDLVNVMKRKLPVLSFSLTTLLMLSLASCSSTNSSSDSATSQDTSSSVTSVDNTIDDAYEDNRPDYDSSFDYDSEYEPSDPVDPEMTVIVSLSSDSPINFANGTKQMEVKPGTQFTLEDFDLTQIEEGRTLQGFATYNEDGSVKSTFDLESFYVPKENITMTPYFTVPSGYTQLSIGSGANKKFNFDQVPGSITENQTIEYTADVLVHGGDNGYVEVGSSFYESSAITINSALRLDTKSSLITETAVYEFVYNFENLGSSVIHLDGYQISASAEYKGQYAYEERYRMDIDLEPGESIRYTAQYTLGSNSNALTYFVADRSMPSGMYLGMSMAMKKTDLTEPETVSEAEASVTGTVNLQLPEGITVDGYNTTQTSGTAITVPTADQITNTTGKEIAGWYIVGSDPLTLVDSTTLVGEETTITIAPYFYSTYGDTLIPGSATTGNIPNHVGTYDSDASTLTDNAENLANFSANPALVSDVRGTNVGYSGTLNTSDYFSLATTSNVTANNTYTYQYSFENNSGEAISFDLYHLQSELSLTDAIKSETITIDAHSTKVVELEITYTTSSSNFNSLFLLRSNVTNLDLDVVIAQQVVAQSTGTIQLQLPEGITVSSDYQTEQLAGEAIILPTSDQITNTTGREILGWYIVEDSPVTFIDETTLVESNTVTIIAPYFASNKGDTTLTPGSGKTNSLPDHFGAMNEDGTLTDYEDSDTNIANFTVTPTVLDSVKGSNYQYNGTLQTNEYFRVLTGAGSDGIVANETYRFNYTVCNNSSTSISFDLYQIQSGILLTNSVASETITLGANETKEIEITIALTNKNSNIMTIFLMKQEASNLNLDLTIAKTHVEDAPKESHTLTLGGDADVTFGDGSKTSSVEVGSTLPEVTNNTGRTIAGYYDSEGNTYSASGFTMPNSDLTIYPYFAVTDTYYRLWPSTAKNGGVPSTGSLTDSTYWTKTCSGSGYSSLLDSAKTIVKGSNGLDEEGVKIQYSGDIAKGDTFRLDTSLGNASVEGQPGRLEAGTHTFLFNFENRGTTTISFNLYMINSGSDTSSTTNNMITFTLGAGEFISMSVSPTYTSGNGNCLPYFEALSAISAESGGLSLAMSMAVKYNTSTL